MYLFSASILILKFRFGKILAFRMKKLELKDIYYLLTRIGYFSTHFDSQDHADIEFKNSNVVWT